MKKAGTILLIIGLIFTVFTGLDFVTKVNVMKIGKVNIHTNKNHSISWPSTVGVIVMAIGAGFYLIGTKEQYS